MWPQDADGDALRRLESSGFDFFADCEIDFNVDFTDWPPHEEALSWLRSTYPRTSVIEPEEGFSGYVQFKIVSKLTYRLVIDVQAETTSAVQQYGGSCESWGVLRSAP
jgi:hypothetical protein